MYKLGNILSYLLLLFLCQSGYGHNATVSGVNPYMPTAAQAITVLYLILVLITLIIGFYLYLRHRQKLGEQKIVLEAIQNNREIPTDYIKSSRRQLYQRNAIVITAIGIGVLLASKTLNLPLEIPLLVVISGIGFFVASRFITE